MILSSRWIVLLLAFGPSCLAVKRNSPDMQVRLSPDPVLQLSSITPSELATHLGIHANGFSFQGKSVSYRLLIEDARGVEEFSGSIASPGLNPGQKAVPGRILLFMAPSEIHLVAKVGDQMREHRIPLPKDALWYGWNRASGTTYGVGRGSAVPGGVEVELYREERQKRDPDTGKILPDVPTASVRLVATFPDP